MHPVLPYILSSSDDMLIKLWDWDKASSTMSSHVMVCAALCVTAYFVVGRPSIAPE